MTDRSAAIGVVGVGAMGSAMAAGLARHVRVVVEDQIPGLADQVAALHGVESGDAAVCGVVVVAVKPQDLGEVLSQMVPRMRDGAVLASVAAGWPLTRLSAVAPDRPIIRLMPNLAVASGKGVVAMASRGVDDAAAIVAALQPLGSIVEMDEEMFPVATAIGGSGPGFLAYVAAALVRAGTDAGLSGPDARAMVRGVMDGTASLLDEDIDPASLQARVTSPGGTTAAGVEVLDAAGVAGSIENAVRAAAARAAEL